MLQPRTRMRAYVLSTLLIILTSIIQIKGLEDINTSPRRRRQDSNDVTTVLLVDSHGRSSFGRFLSVKPDLGLITSTARTFIQEGVTTEYATQVLGTTLDNGRLYAHLLTKSSRVLYDGDSPSSKATLDKKWSLDQAQLGGTVNNFVRNTDFIAPTETTFVFPTALPVQFVEKPQQSLEEEILEEEPSNNPRVPYENLKNDVVLPLQNNVKIFKINPQVRDLTQDNIIVHKENAKAVDNKNNFTPSKVRPWDNLPTFTVRNEFSPSGFSYLGDFPEFDSSTEANKATTAAERKAKFLFNAGLLKPEAKDLQTITYTGFADFTTTVGDTVIVFSPHTSEAKLNQAQVTKISVQPTIRPSLTFKSPKIGTTVNTFRSQEPDVETRTLEGHKLEMKSSLPSMVIDKQDRAKRPKGDGEDETVDMDAKSAVLAHEQHTDESTTQLLSTSSGKSTIIFTPDIIEPSESQTPMLSTPSHEDIAKIFASLQAQANKQATQPLNTPATIFLDDTTSSTKQISTGATTIFFENDLPIDNTAVLEQPTTSKIVDDKSTTTTSTSSTTTTTTTTTTEKETTTTEKDITTTTTENIPETTDKLTTTTQQEPETTNVIETTSEHQATTPEIVSNEIDTEKSQPDADVICTDGTKIEPTTTYKTLTYLTTFFIPEDDGVTTTSIKSNIVTSTQIGFETTACITPSTVLNQEEASSTASTTTESEKTTTQEITTQEADTTTTELTTTESASTTPALETTPSEITTERRHVTESEPETTEATTDSGEEIELIFKTLYTTYTYLTTYFQDTTSSIASKIVVTTNVITSTLVPGSEASDSAVAGLFERDDNLISSYKSRTVTFDDIAEIAPTKILDNILPTVGYSNDDDVKSTPLLNDAKVQQNGVKTYYTTYTYFTTIFVDGETEISSRTEVYTNYVTPSISASAVLEDIAPTRLFDNNDQVEAPESDIEDVKKKILNLNVAPQNSYNSTITRSRTAAASDSNDTTQDIYASTKDKLDNNILATTVNKEQSYVTLQRGSITTEDAPIENNLFNLNDYETISTMVTDVRSSTSEGARRIIDNVDKRNVLDDQIVSESNNDSEIIPSPTLLLQTSYTTFTYFTTMYHGTTSSNVVSRLETITNVVTETLTPTHTLSVEDLSLPITYFTTFTYWTTLYKDGTTKVTSREETVSNVVTPTPSLTTDLPTIKITPTVSQSSESSSIQPSTVGDDDLTTYFTTYTYYTTSYVGDSTVLKSRLETATTVVNNTADIDSNQIGRAIGTASQNKIEDATTKTSSLDSSTNTSTSVVVKPTGLLSTIINTIENSGTTTILSTDVFGTYIDGLYAKVLESTSSILTSTIAPSSVVENLKPTGVVSINKGKIVDAEGVSTLFYTTQAVGTYIDNLYAQVIESTSSLKIDEERKSALATDVPIVHRTGLVRLIEGSIIQNETTTLYQSKVIGTVIDGRYAQVIESTSSFLIGKASAISPSSSVSEIVPTPTKAPDQHIASTAVPISPSPVVIEGSLSDSSKIDDESSTEESEEEDDEDQDGNTRSKSRLTFQTKKRTFTPVIRPFVSRPRPTFAPKRKNSGASTATTVTRSDVTPTVTAVPVSKGPRFGGGRRSSSSVNAIVPTASGSRRFARPKSTQSSGISASGRRSSSRIQPTATGFSSSRRGGFRSSIPGASSARPGNSRFRIRPTLASSLNRPTATATPSPDDDNNLTTQVTDNPTDSNEDSNDTTLPISTTEAASKRAQNPLLRFRRPLARPSTPRPAPQKTTKPKGVKTTTTPKPKSAARPNPVLNRPRTNSLFPRRNLFTTTTTPAPIEEEDEELDEEAENEDEDTDYDQSQTNTQTEAAPTTPETRRGRSSNVQIKPFVGFRRRSRREVNYSRFRRPGSRTTAAPVTEEPETEAPAPKQSRNRYSARSRSKTTQGTTPAPTRKRISPTKSLSGRSQFTLREKDNTRSNFRRPITSNPRPRTTQSSRPKSPRLRTTSQPEPKRQSTRTSSRRRNNSNRQRQHDDFDSNFVVPQNDGTITVTHQIPTEVTIPVVNGKMTEYKNVITAKYSTEVLVPKQYSTSANAFGKDVTVLLSEATSVGDNGATLITQFVLNETPTTSVTFTPTYIRGRKTSFSHVIPSTAYGVERVVNTIQPALAAQAPLANILLSQLLLGGLQPQNPLLALQNPGIPATPTTEFKTRATTYVTTVTSATSTVIPLTFRGKEILTTIIDSSVNVVTATEFITDTIVVTPTLPFAAPAPQLNTLLLPLLQQQLAQAPASLQPQQPAGVLSVDRPEAQALLKEADTINSALEDAPLDVLIDEVATQPPKRKSSRKNKKKPTTPAPTEPPKETSVITLYVSGRTPNEFSTVLSTVIVGENDRKRRDVKPSKSLDDLVVSTLDYFDTYVMPASKEISLDSATEALPTQSLESIIGDVSKHITTQTSSESFESKPTKSSSKPSKKYKINVNDLDEKAPLMPKVETSLVLRGDHFQQLQDYVSSIVGHDRVKRDVDDDNDKIPKPKRRVVKKLKRVNPVGHNEDEITTKRPRRRLLIKKKKKRLLSVPKSEEIAQSSKTRRKVVVTRKRLLIKSSSSEIIEPTLQPNHLLTNSVTSEESTDSTEVLDETTDSIEEIEDSSEAEESSEDNPQHVPDYEPFFPELSDSLDAPVLLLKTTVLSSIELQTKTVVHSRLRTYTFIVTRVNGNEQVVTSTTEIRPQTKTTILTEPLTKFTTLTLLDFDATSTLNPIPMTPFPESSQLKTAKEAQGRAFEEARYNLATRVMSNGVEVIVAGDKSTLPGEPDIKRVLPSTIYKPVTLKPSTLSHHMMMMLPDDASNINNLASLYPNEFVTKTCLTTFTYLTTYLDGSTTTVSSHEQVVSNIATEDRNTGKILPTPAMGITLTQYPNLSVGVFHTTYTYLNTIIDGEQPIVITSKHTVTNTVTAPDDYLSLLQPSENVTALKDTNTYYSTVSLEKTLYEGQKSQIVSTNEVLTQVVITESIPPKATSVMTSYIALDFDDIVPTSLNYTTTDVVKTYYVTYTYYNTEVDNGNTVVKTNVSTSSDVVTEKLYLHPKHSAKPDKKKQKVELSGDSFKILATKTYHTTFTYFTTLLQEGNSASPTVISSNSKVVENLVTETIDSSLLDKKYLNGIKKEIKEGKETLTKLATLLDGQKLEITIIANTKISPTKVLPIERTKMPDASSKNNENKIEIEASTPSVIVGSTIIFLDDESSSTATPSLSSSEVKTSTSSKVVKKTKTVTSTSKLRRSSKTKAKTQSQTVNPTKAADKKQPATKIVKPANQVPDLLGLGSININSLQALTPVLNAMAGLIQTNLKSTRRNDSIITSTTPKSHYKLKAEESATTEHQFPDIQNRSPIYIPVGGISDELEIAESQNVATFHLQETVDWDGYKDFKPTHESPLLNGGIPISPGEVITANSDVIVGKPGRIGPRVPSIPLNQVKDDGYGMKPPLPVHNKWPKRNEHKHIPIPIQKPIIHAPSKDDYIGPPPPLRSDKHKHIPLNRDQRPIEQVYAQSQNNYGVTFGLNEVNHEIKIPNIQDEIQKNYELAAKDSFPVYAEGQGQKFGNSNPMKEYNLQPSIVLPEVIERSTGQPLLVNIQPSQVAFVNIPHNRTTALIYGGSTEPHRNGQYFDDPSPYPEPEFSGIEFSNGVPQIASVYHDSPPNQKHVGGVIKVAPQPVKVEDQVQFHHINPSRPNLVNYYQNQEISVDVAPISFGMIEKDNDFNAHIINHQQPNSDETVDLRPPVDDNHQAADGEIIDLTPPSNHQTANQRKPSHGNHLQYRPNSDNDQSRPPSADHRKPVTNIQHFNRENSRPNNVDLNQHHHRPINYQHFNQRPNINKHKLPPRNYQRPPPRPADFEKLELMTPPPPNLYSQRPYLKPNRPHPQKPLPIPLIPEEEQSSAFINVNNRQPVDPTFSDSTTGNHEDDEDYDDDLTNEDGEVIQESNSRPLRPGQVPIEILKAKTTSTTEAPRNSTFVRFPIDDGRPIVSNPRPFNNIPFVTPENQQTNQINIQQDVYQETSKPNEGFITYIGTITEKPIEIFHGTTKRPAEVYQSSSQKPIQVYYSTTKQPIVINNNIHDHTVQSTRRPTTSIRHDNFAQKTRKPIPSYIQTTSTTSQPYRFQDILKNRPLVTSLPIDPPTTSPPVIIKQIPHTQTEKPFKTPKPVSITDLLNREKVPIASTTESAISDMEIMKPPPPLIPEINMLPPKIEINSPGANIHRVPNIEINSPDQEAHESTPRPFVPKPSQEIVPPKAPETNDDTVVGLNPPPLVSTHKPIINPVTTIKVPFVEDIQDGAITTTEVTRVTRPRRPFTSRPTNATRKPIRVEIYKRNRTSTTTTIAPTPTIISTPSLEVIIGNPNIASSKDEFKETTDIITTPTHNMESSTSSTSKLEDSSISTNSPIHHAGNEVKIIDDDSSTSSTRTPVLTTLKETKSVVPTRFITHTKTSTVTITKTTVVKTLGGPPSTLTLLVTKTEKSTIVDTVTEFHTLVKPTSIVETITTTISTGSSLYPAEVYGSSYPSIKIRPSSSISNTNTVLVVPTITIEDTDDDLDDFIINDTDPPIVDEKVNDNDSIFVVMTDKNKGSVIKIPNTSHETQDRDEMLNNNEVNNVLLGGIFISHPPSLEVPNNDRCEPDCKASRNELCQKVEGIMRCVCRPGFARMFPDRPCIPTYTYSLNIDLDRHGRNNLAFVPELSNHNSSDFSKLSAITHEALDRMVMQSDLRDIYHGVHIHNYAPRKQSKQGITTQFYLQLSDNTDENRLEDVFKKYLRNNNYSLGGTDVYAASLENLEVHDFDECTNQKFHDCSENAQCFNLKGTYTCSCKEGFADLSENILYPGRICSAELVGCERCNYHGTCYSRGEDQVLCECFQWYTGETCYINLKVLLIALVTLGAILFVLLLVCIILTCCRKKPNHQSRPTTINFLPTQRANRGTNDRRAMIQDSSSEDSRSETNTLPYVANKNKKLKGALKKTSQQHNSDIENGTNTLISFPDQKDRSLTVMIPRAKYHPAPPTSPLMNYTSFDARKPSVPQVSNEAKLLSYLDAGPSPSKGENKRKYSATVSESFIDESKPGSRKTSGALVSAGFEVSATVLPNNMGTLGTTCGTEADRSENATLIQKISADLLSSTGTRSQFNTLRENDIDPVSNWMDITRVNFSTISEARSYDETTIPPPMKSFRGDYDSKPSSQHQNDEANTMAERDLGSTFLLPHTHLYKPDRGSDISGFESL